MKFKTLLAVGLSFSMTVSLSGCMGSAAGVMASSVASSAASGAMTSGSNRARFERQTCDQLAAEIRSARATMINPLAIPSTQAYINDARAVSQEKNCPEV